MWWIVGVVLAVVLLLSLASLANAWQLRGFGRSLIDPGQPRPEDVLPTSVIIPCKGDDGRLLENLESVLGQEHLDIEFVLVTATEDDPARSVFTELERRHPCKRIRSVVAGLRTDCSQQNNNQVAGVAAADPRSEVLVIMDSDGRADRHFVARLVAPLSDPGVGAVSGFRWYQPRWSSLADVLRTAWNAGGFAFIINPRAGFVWGGAMAVRRSVYEKAGIAEIWGRSLSDDMTLSRKLRSLGLVMRFVPRCIVISREQDNLRSVVSWTNRQTLVTRFYNRPFWLMATVFHGMGNLLGWGLLVTGAAATMTGPTPASAAALLGGGLWVGHLWLMAALMLDPLGRLLRPLGIDLGARGWFLVMTAPLASLLQGMNSFNSLLTRRIRWAGVTYEIYGSERMQVV